LDGDGVELLFDAGRSDLCCVGACFNETEDSEFGYDVVVATVDVSTTEGRTIAAPEQGWIVADAEAE